MVEPWCFKGEGTFGWNTNMGKKDSRKLENGEIGTDWLVHLLLVLFLEILVNIKCMGFCMTSKSKSIFIFKSSTLSFAILI